MLNFIKLELDTAGIITVVTILAIVIALLAVGLFGKKRISGTKSITYGAICVSLSFTLSFINVSMAYGGSITVASMLPLIIYTLMFGWYNGLIVGVVYGLLQFIQHPHFLTPVQFMLDYIIAFGTVTVVGIFFKNSNLTKSFVLGACCFYFLRFISHLLAGIIFYSTPDMKMPTLPIFGDTDGMSAFIYSFLYNIIYMLPEAIIGIGVGLLVVKNKNASNAINKYRQTSVQ